VVSSNRLFKEIVNNFTHCGISNPSFETIEIISHFAKIPKHSVLYDINIADLTQKIINKAVNDRCEGKPLQYILGEWEFCGKKIFCREGVLIPREDTETLIFKTVEYINKKYTKGNNLRILDLCCGSGCVFLGLWLHLKDTFNVDFTAVDISDSCLKLSRDNMALWGAEGIKLVKADVLAPSTLNEVYDVIVSNPPYIPKEALKELDKSVINYEPTIALDGGSDGLLYYRSITNHFLNNLKKGGLLAVEIGFDEARAVTSIFNKARLSDIKVFKDIGGNDRVVTAIKT